MQALAVRHQEDSAKRLLSRRVSPLTNILLKIALAVVSLFLSTCKESLPAYQTPTLLFEGSFQPVYALTPKENALHLLFWVRNTFDETLEGNGVFNGEVQLVLLRDPTVTKTLSLSGANIIRAKAYNPNTGTLRIDPSDTVVFDVTWDLSQRPLLNDNGQDMISRFLNLQPDPGCAFRHKSEPEDFAVQGSIQIFGSGSPVAGKQVIYRFCLVDAWVGQNNCPPVGSPCNMIISSGKQ
jgi:hypothetical protein